MSTAKTNDSPLSMDGALWRRVASWVRSQVYQDHQRQIDVEQIVNDSLQQWWEVADVAEKEDAISSGTTLLSTIVRCRIKDAIQFQRRLKRDFLALQQFDNVQQLADSYSMPDRVDVNDTLEALLLKLSEREVEILRLRLLDYNWNEIQELSGSTALEMRRHRWHLRNNSRSLLLTMK